MNHGSSIINDVTQTPKVSFPPLGFARDKLRRESICLRGNDKPSFRVTSAISLWFLLPALLFVSCEKLPTESPQVPSSFIRGITFVDWSADGYLIERADTALNRIAATGASHLAILITAYQPTRSSNE